MKVLLVALLVGAAAAFVERAEWEAFKQQHAKSYVNPIEEFYRMKIYADNKAYVAQHMKEYAEGKHTFTLALNKFADFTSEEFARGFKGLKIGSAIPHAIHQMSGSTAPETMDWRDAGAVTPVQEQGQCGSSWAFSINGAVEGAWKLSGHSLVALSVQQLVDCSGDYGNFGCNGGYMDASFEYIRDNGIESEADYPYTAVDGKCRANGHTAATLSSYVDIPEGSESALLDAVATVGPVSVVIDATRSSFQFYSGGVYDDPSCATFYPPNHPVLVAGYGTENAQDYWLVKNWWGTSWGDDGYIKMSRNNGNQCGIASQASYPVV